MKNFNDFFDAIYIINLDRRPDRFKAAIKELNKYGIQAERFPAVDGKESFPEVKYPFASELATCLSHINVWKAARARNLKDVLVLEDDVVFEPKFKKHLANFMETLPEYWEVIYFGGNHVEKPVYINKFLYRIKFTFALHCYAVNSTAYDKLIAKAEKETTENMANHQNLQITCAIDVILAKMQPALKCYCPNIKLAWQAPGFSDIQESEVNYDEVLKK